MSTFQMNLSFIERYTVSEQKLMILLVKKEDHLVDNFYPAITASNNKATMFVILIIGLTAGPAVSL